jgi:hypothetical protein
MITKGIFGKESWSLQVYQHIQLKTKLISCDNQSQNLKMNLKLDLQQEALTTFSTTIYQHRFQSKKISSIIQLANQDNRRSCRNLIKFDKAHP